MKSPDRIVAATRVESDQNVTNFAVVTLSDADAVAKPLQDTRPAHGSDLVAVIELERRGCDELDVHVVKFLRSKYSTSTKSLALTRQLDNIRNSNIEIQNKLKRAKPNLKSETGPFRIF